MSFLLPQYENKARCCKLEVGLRKAPPNSNNSRKIFIDKEKQLFGAYSGLKEVSPRLSLTDY